MTTNGGGGQISRNINADIGRRINLKMADAGMTQGQLAAAMGLTQAAISRKLSGERPWFPGELMDAARILDMTVGELFGESVAAPLFSHALMAGAAA